jgi:hypothetical protein
MTHPNRQPEPFDNVRIEAEKAYQEYLVTVGARKGLALARYLRLINIYKSGEPKSRPLQDYLNNGPMPDFHPHQKPDSPLGGIQGVAGLPKLD